MNKGDIRKSIKSLKCAINDRLREDSVWCVANKIEQLSQFIEGSNILLYYSLPDEFPTEPMIKKWLLMGKNIYLPRVAGNDIKITKVGERGFVKGQFNILEPNETDYLQDLSLIDVAIIPGVAFDKNLNRLGRGRGYYDKFLKCFNGLKVGIGFDFQIVDDIPTEPHDVKMDMIISPSLTYSTQGE